MTTPDTRPVWVHRCAPCGTAKASRRPSSSCPCCGDDMSSAQAGHWHVNVCGDCAHTWWTREPGSTCPVCESTRNVHSTVSR